MSTAGIACIGNQRACSIERQRKVLDYLRSVESATEEDIWMRLRREMTGVEIHGAVMALHAKALVTRVRMGKAWLGGSRWRVAG